MTFSFFRFPRSLSRHPAYVEASLAHRAVLTTFLDHMCFSPTEFNAHGNILLLKPGQFCTTERDFAELCGPEVNRFHVRRGLDYFSKSGFLHHEVHQRKTIITLTHRETYECLFQEMHRILHQTCTKLAPQTRNKQVKEEITTIEKPVVVSSEIKIKNSTSEVDVEKKDQRLIIYDLSPSKNESQSEKILTDLLEIGFTVFDAKNILKKHSDNLEKVSKAILVTKQETRNNPPGFFRDALEGNWEPKKSKECSIEENRQFALKITSDLINENIYFDIGISYIQIGEQPYPIEINFNLPTNKFENALLETIEKIHLANQERKKQHRFFQEQREKKVNNLVGII